MIELKKEDYQALIDMALQEDLRELGDTTTLATVPADLQAKAVMLVKSDLICAGLPLVEAVFKQVDPKLEFKALTEDGAVCTHGHLLAEITGSAQSLLTAERTALNFIQRLSGVATLTAKYVAACGDSDTKILDTRKTTPGYRHLEKYAVAMGGAVNHRIGLYDRVMIKDNHRELASLTGPGSIIRSVEACRAKYPEIEVEVEADTLAEVQEALEAKADYILLDNMSNEMMAEAVTMRGNVATKLEISGGVVLERIPELAKIGADFISVGALTHSFISADISLEIQL